MINMNILPSEKERQWAMACHLSAFFGLIILPLGAILGPLCIWMLKKKHHPFINNSGKEALNFQISMMLWFLLSLALIRFGVGIFLIITIEVLNIIFIIMATFSAAKGRDFHYPLSIRIIR